MIDKLYNNNNLPKEELGQLIKDNLKGIDPKLLKLARKTRENYYGNKVFFRGLIEISNHCKNNCLYCGIRGANLKIDRYRLNKENILACCRKGYDMGFRTFVLQGGEDGYYSDDRVADIIDSIKNEYPDCALTLSLGEKPYKTYKKYYQAGADRYLLRHESATDSHYERLHPKGMEFNSRKQCLYDLKEIGFQVGAGFMVGSPYQTIDNLVNDLLFLKELEPHMVGIGPFIPHKDTRFAAKEAGGLEDTIVMIALTRLLLPKSLLPATTALATIDSMGREKALNAGANVVMPNLSPGEVREYYSLYDNKRSTGDESANHIEDIRCRIKEAGYTPDFSRGDYHNFNIKGGVR
ncbi:MAG: [FeFe] hydrogenase H-cluster radical SAM maturase HydE [Epulopiscium sp.]|nr:[FeFe] hydrogenase H-cluster radical SAM maturase HydE [Candidatus Epulonipiscium sp.]